jgi:5-formyltetrahydrofolate cyclo-ligase
MSPTAKDIRKTKKLQRLALDEDERAFASVIIANKLLKHRRIKRADCIAVYMPFNGEVDCRFFMKSAKLRKKRIFLPVLRKSQLAFAPLKKATKMHANRLGILEPVYKNHEIVNPTQLDAVITPLVAFDIHCNRLGMGGGFYDRCFAFRKHRRKWRRPFLIGVAYDFQRVDMLLPEAWDVPVDVVITEQQSYGSY